MTAIGNGLFNWFLSCTNEWMAGRIVRTISEKINSVRIDLVIKSTIKSFFPETTNGIENRFLTSILWPVSFLDFRDFWYKSWKNKKIISIDRLIKKQEHYPHQVARILLSLTCECVAVSKPMYSAESFAFCSCQFSRSVRLMPFILPCLTKSLRVRMTSSTGFSLSQRSNCKPQ